MLTEVRVIESRFASIFQSELNQALKEGFVFEINDVVRTHIIDSANVHYSVIARKLPPPFDYSKWPQVRPHRPLGYGVV